MLFYSLIGSLKYFYPIRVQKTGKMQILHCHFLFIESCSLTQFSILFETTWLNVVVRFQQFKIVQNVNTTFAFAVCQVGFFSQCAHHLPMYVFDVWLFDVLMNVPLVGRQVWFSIDGRWVCVNSDAPVKHEQRKNGFIEIINFISDT